MPKPKPMKKTLPASYSAGFLVKISKLSALGQRLNGTFASLIADLGGVENLNRGKLMLVERLTFLQEFLQQIEQDVATDPLNKSEALGRWTQGVNSMSGLVRTLGFDRQDSQRWLDDLYAPEKGPSTAENELSDDEWDSSPDLEPRPQDGPRKPQKRKGKRS